MLHLACTRPHLGTKGGDLRVLAVPSHVRSAVFDVDITAIGLNDILAPTSLSRGWGPVFALIVRRRVQARLMAAGSASRDDGVARQLVSVLCSRNE